MSPVVNVFCPCNKNYTIQHLPEGRFKALDPGTENLDNIAILFYRNNPNLDNIVVNTYGGWHETIPNPPHLTIQINYIDIYGNPQNTGKLHYSKNIYGMWYIQPIVHYTGGGKRKKKHSKRKKSKKMNK